MSDAGTRIWQGEARKALSYYKKSGKTYYVCLALKLIAEAQYYMGFKESAINSFQSVENLADKLNQDKWKVLLNIGMSFNRLGETHLRDKYLTKCLPLIPDDETETILRVNDMFGFR
jgi:tetratricopeptide (TPR) repeat protein